MSRVEPNMVNRLAGIQRDNIMTLFARHDLSFPNVAKYTGLSTQTIRNTFGQNPRHSPSKKTLAALYGLFSGLTEDCFDVYNSVEGLETEVVVKEIVAEQKEQVTVFNVEIIQLKKIRLEIDRTVIESEVSEALAKKLVDLLIYGEDDL